MTDKITNTDDVNDSVQPTAEQSQLNSVDLLSQNSISERNDGVPRTASATLPEFSIRGLDDLNSHAEKHHGRHADNESDMQAQTEQKAKLAAARVEDKVAGLDESKVSEWREMQNNKDGTYSSEQLDWLKQIVGEGTHEAASRYNSMMRELNGEGKVEQSSSSKKDAKGDGKEEKGGKEGSGDSKPEKGVKEGSDGNKPHPKPEKPKQEKPEGTTGDSVPSIGVTNPGEDFGFKKNPR